ncbi:MAG: hypothetical protein JW861_05810, partial [Bacteroidales bacterium]|nr:hypothetical protein [Bacteroidales bacterium]
EFFWGELIIDSTGTIYKKEFRPVGTNGQSKMVRTFDSKSIVGTGLIEGKTDWVIYLYKINENLVHDTMYPGTYTYDSLCPYPITSGQIDISDCLIVTGIGEIPTPQEYYAGLQNILIRVFPNPARGVITFEFEHTAHHTDLELRCISVMSNRVHREKLYPSQGASRVDVSAWPPGIYLAVVLSNGRPAGRTKFAVR